MTTHFQFCNHNREVGCDHLKKPFLLDPNLLCQAAQVNIEALASVLAKQQSPHPSMESPAVAWLLWVVATWLALLIQAAQER